MRMGREAYSRTSRRREFLATLGTGSTAFLAGCGEDGESNESPTETSEEDERPTGTTTWTPTREETATEPIPRDKPPNGPPDGGNWTLSFADDFDDGELDTDVWNYGWGWGNDSNYTPSRMSENNVTVEDSLLKLELTQVAEDDVQYHSGGVHTQDTLTIEPPIYLEASIRALDLPSSNNAWWCKPNNENWPPEIDFMEVPTHKLHRSMHNIHYDETLNCTPAPADQKGETTNGTYHPSETMAAQFYSYGVKWTEEEVTHWVDGDHVGTTKDHTANEHLNKCLPHYMMLTTIAGHNNWFGMPPDEGWDEYRTTMAVDYVRTWKRD